MLRTVKTFKLEHLENYKHLSMARLQIPNLGMSPNMSELKLQQCAAYRILKLLKGEAQLGQNFSSTLIIGLYLCGFSDPHFRFFLGSRTTFILTGVMNIKYLLILPMINFYQRIDPSLLIEFQRHLSRNKKLKKYNTKCGSHCLIED